MNKHSKQKDAPRMTSVSSGQSDLRGLSENEQEGLRKLRAAGGAARRPGAFGLNDQSRELSEAAGRISDLEKENRVLSRRNEELDRDLRAARGELDTAKQNNNTLRARNEDLTRQLDGRRDSSSENRELQKALDAARNAVKDLEDEAERQRSAASALEERIAALMAELEGSRSDLAALRETSAGISTERDSLKTELDSLRASMSSKDRAAVSRPRADTLRSDMFEDGNYDVRLGSDMTYITIRRDEAGKASCWNREIRLPRLEAYVGFRGEATWDAEVSEGIIRVDLKRALADIRTD